MGGKNKEILNPYVIACEGIDYVYTLIAILQRHAELKISLWNFKQDDLSIDENFDVLFNQSAFKRKAVQGVGIIQDAETNRDGAADSIKRQFGRAQLPVPNSQLTLATEAGKPHTAFLVIPYNKPIGCLEDSMLDACMNPRELACAESYIACISGCRAPYANPTWPAKAKVHAMIAGNQECPEMPLGISMQKKMWNLEHDSLDVLLRFMRLLSGHSETSNPLPA